MNSSTENLVGADKVMDVRPIPCSVKHGLIIKQWLEIPVGDHFVLLNDHDPVPLRYQFAAQSTAWPGAASRATVSLTSRKTTRVKSLFSHRKFLRNFPVNLA